MKRLIIIACLLAEILVLRADPPDIYDPKYSDKQGRMTKDQVRAFYLDYTTQGMTASQILDPKNRYQDQADGVVMAQQADADAQGFYPVARTYANITHHPLESNTGPKPKKPTETNAQQLADYSKTQTFLYVRKTTSLMDSDFSVSKGDITSEKKADGAIFSYNRLFSTDRNTWTTQGVLEAPVRFPSDHSENSLQEVWYVPAVEFNQLSGNGVIKTKKIDSLTFQNGTFMVTDFDDVGTSLIRASQVTETDFNFSSLLVGGEAEYEPVNDDAHLGTPEHLFVDKKSNLEWITVMQRLVLHLDGGTVLDAGNKPTLHDGQMYNRFGPVYSFDIYPGAQMNLPDALASSSKLEFSYGHYIGISGKACNDYKVNLNMSLDNQGIFGFTVAYEHGGLDANGDRANQVTAGLVIKK